MIKITGGLTARFIPHPNSEVKVYDNLVYVGLIKFQTLSIYCTNSETAGQIAELIRTKKNVNLSFANGITKYIVQQNVFAKTTKENLAGFGDWLEQ